MSNQFLKLRRSAVPGRVPSTSSIDFGEIALNTFDGLAFIKRSGSNGEEVITLGSREGAFTGSFSGSFVGNGGGLFNISASAIVGLNLSQIATGSVSASVGVGASSFSVVSGSNTFLYVSSSGNVGIGTSTPSTTLDVAGNIRGGTFIVGTTQAPTIYSSNGSLYHTINSTSYNYIWLRGSEIMRLTGGGNLLLGTTSDSGERLQVSGSSRFIGNMVITGSGNTSGTNALSAVNSSNGSLLTVRNDGNVGIGTSTPDYNLHLRKDGSNVDIYLQNDASNIARIATGTNWIIGPLGEMTTISGLIGNAYGIFRSGTTVGIASYTTLVLITANVIRARLFNTGNFVIGSSIDNGARLQVAGSSTFASDMTISGSGNTSATNALTVVNSSNSSLLTVRNDGLSTFGGNIHFLNANTRLLPDTRGGSIQSGYLTLQIGSTNRTFTIYNNVNDVLTVGSEIGAGIFNVPTFQFIVGATSPNVSAQAQIDSTTRGFLLPRMTQAQRLAISNPAQGLLVYDTGSVTEGLWLYNSGSNPGWQEVLTNSGSQSISGSITVNDVTVTGTLTAQTIVAQTITSSTDYVSGSTIFGNSLSNTHQFTGSVSITGSLSLPYLSTGSVLFAGSNGAVSQNNSNFFWDNTNSRLGIGTNAPASRFEVVAGADANGIKLRGRSADDISNFFFSSNNGLNQYGYFQHRGTAMRVVNNVGDLEFFNGTSTAATNERIRLFAATGNVRIQDGGTFTDNGARLQVSGDTTMSGSGNTSGTRVLTLSNSSTLLWGFRNDGMITNLAQSQTTQIYTQNQSTLGALSLAGDLSLVISNNRTSAGPLNHGSLFVTKAQSETHTNSPTRFLIVGHQTGLSFAPTSGTATLTVAEILATINQTGGANGITRGLYVNPTLTSAWDFRAIEWSNNAATAPSASWGLYGAGTADNYLAGKLGIGSTTLTANTLRISRAQTGATTLNTILSSGQINSDVTVAVNNFSSQLVTQAASFTLGNFTHFRATDTLQGAGSTITQNFGFRVDDLTFGTSNFGFYGDISSGANKWNLYMNGSANNYMAGKLLIGTTVTTNTEQLTVGGNVLLRPTGTAGTFAETSIKFFAASDSGFGASIFTTDNSGYGIGLGISTREGASQSEKFRIFRNGNVLIQSGSTFTDSGHRLQVAGNTYISGSLDILDAELNYQRNNNVTTGSARLIASIPTGSYNAAFFDYTIVSGSNARAGTVTSVWVSSSVEWNETYTNDIGSTTDVSLYAAITGSSIGLFATSSINNTWTIKSLIRTI